MKILIAHHDRTGSTEKAARAIAQALRALPNEVHLEEILEAKGRGGVIGFLGALRKREADIEPVKAKVGDYDLVIVGTPIRAWTVTPPLRSFLTARAQDIRQAAFFCTTTGAGGRRAFEAMEEAADATALATAVFKERHVRRADEYEFLGKVEEFVGEIVRAIGRGGVPVQAARAAEPDGGRVERPSEAILTFESSAAFLERFDSFRGGVLRTVELSYGADGAAWSACVVLSAPEGDVTLTIEDVKELRLSGEGGVLSSGIRIGFLGDLVYLDLRPRSDSAETLADFMRSGLLIAGPRCTWEVRPPPVRAASGRPEHHGRRPGE